MVAEIGLQGGMLLGFARQDGQERTELMRPAQPDGETDPLRASCFPLLPFGNRVRGNSFAFAGRRFSLRLNRKRQAIQRTARAGDQGGGHLGVAGCRRQPSMAEQGLNDADVGAGLEQVRGEAVPQRVDGDRLAQFGPARRHPAGLL